MAESSWKLGQFRWAAPESLPLKVGPFSQIEWTRSRVDGCTSCTVAGGWRGGGGGAGGDGGGGEGEGGGGLIAQTQAIRNQTRLICSRDKRAGLRRAMKNSATRRCSH